MVSSRLLPRYYTISSSSLVHPTSIHITVACIQMTRKDGTAFEGVCSNYLAGVGTKGCVRVFTRESAFRLPVDVRVCCIYFLSCFVLCFILYTLGTCDMGMEVSTIYITCDCHLVSLSLFGDYLGLDIYMGYWEHAASNTNDHDWTRNWYCSYASHASRTFLYEEHTTQSYSGTECLIFWMQTTQSRLSICEGTESLSNKWNTHELTLGI